MSYVKCDRTQKHFRDEIREHWLTETVKTDSEIDLLNSRIFLTDVIVGFNIIYWLSSLENNNAMYYNI